MPKALLAKRGVREKHFSEAGSEALAVDVGGRDAGGGGGAVVLLESFPSEPGRQQSVPPTSHNLTAALAFHGAYVTVLIRLPVRAAIEFMA